MDRIVIIGAAGSGKTTLANRLAAEFNLRAIDLDDLYWRANWQQAPEDEFRRDTAAAIAAAPRWALAGNYKTIRDIVWTQADTVVWLDYSLALTFNRLARRSLARVWDRKPLCNGNTETLSKAFSYDSVMYWMLKNFYPRRRENAEIFAHPERYPNVRNFVRLRHPAETERFINGLIARRSPSTAGAPACP
jgi:adenylate kinase family enzyme